MSFNFSKNITVVEPQNLYKWAKVWGKIQKSYYNDKVYLRREKQIEDFVYLNEFKKVYLIKDTDVLTKLPTVDRLDHADLVVITDQKISRLPCHGIVELIKTTLSSCPKIFLCLNRHYINIDNTFCDSSLDNNLNLAITQWLKKELTSIKILDMSLDYLDCGDWFTWVIPDRMYYIEKSCD